VGILMNDKITYQHGKDFLTLPELALLAGKSTKEVLSCLAKSWTVERIINEKIVRNLLERQVSISTQIKVGGKVENYEGLFTVSEELLEQPKSKILLELNRKLVRRYFYTRG